MEKEAEPNIEFVPALAGFRECGIGKTRGYQLIEQGHLPGLLRDPDNGRAYFLRHELNASKAFRLSRLVPIQIKPTPSPEDRSIVSAPDRGIAA